VGAGFQLAGDQGGTPEGADDRGGDAQHDDPGEEQGAVVVGQHVEDVRVQAGQAGEAGAGDREDECDSGDRGVDRNGLGAELPPGEPDHRSASSGAR
jgi:hypothetical protein